MYSRVTDWARNVMNTTMEDGHVVPAPEDSVIEPVATRILIDTTQEKRAHLN